MSRKLTSLVTLAALGALFGVTGCAARKSAPHLQFGSLDLRTNLSRDDIVVLDRVEGTSSSTVILTGLIEIIDGKNFKFLGIPFFTEKYAMLPFGAQSVQETESRPPTTHAMKLLGVSLNVTPTQRAYYKALGKAPDADAVFYKSQDFEMQGIPVLFTTTTVTWKGKAIKLKADK